MKKRLFCGAIILLLAVTLMSGTISADTNVSANVSVGSISAVLTDDDDVITITIGNLRNMISGTVQPGVTKTASFTIQNNTESDYDITGYTLYSTVGSPTRVVNTAMENNFPTLEKSSKAMREAINGLTADEYWQIIDSYYSNIDSDWKNDKSLVQDVLASNGADLQGNPTYSWDVPQDYVDLAENYIEQYVFLTFDELNFPVGSAETLTSLASYEAGSNASMVLGFFEKILSGETMSNEIGLNFDGANMGNAFMGSTFEIKVSLTLTKQISAPPPPPPDPPLPTPTGNVTVKTERFDGEAYNSGDEFTVTLSQSGIVKYTYLLNESNNWTFAYNNVELGVYDVAQSKIASGYSLASINAVSGYEQSTCKLTVAADDDLTITVSNKVNSVPTPKDKEKSNPKTGDESNIAPLIIIAGSSIIIAGLVIFLLIRKKKGIQQ